MGVRAAVVFAVIAGGCQRTAPEDFPPREASSVGTVRAAVADGLAAVPLPPGRCVKATPAEGPPPVAAGPAPGCPADPEPSLPTVPVVRVTFPDAGGIAVDAELVRSEHDTMRGLMYRTGMGADHGMLFDLRFREEHKFWMHNTCIPLDLIYVDEDGLVVGIAENAPTLSDESITVGCPSRWVLEVNAGWSRRHGVKAGQRVSLP
jgi:uncharacterized membrane protein (UPF0127 family)